MRVLIAALLLTVSATISHGAWADNIASCEVVLMEKIKQEGNEGVTEIASFRPAADFIASAYDEDIEVLREIDELPIRAVMCKRKTVVPGESDFPIVATGTPFMISQNFDSTETGLTTIYFKDGKFRSNYNGPELSAAVEAEMKARLETFNAKPHNLAEKEKAMLEKSESSVKEETPLEEEALEDEDKASSTEDPDIGFDDKPETKDDKPTESTEEDIAPAEKSIEAISPEEHEELK